MEVILREDIEKLGNRGQVVKVAAGYARNYLLPKQLAVLATDGNKKIVEQERQAHLRREAKEVADAAGSGEADGERERHASRRRPARTISCSGRSRAQDIAGALEKQGYNIERRKIQLAEPIKQLGEYKVPVRLHKDVTVEIPVTVTREE